MQISKLFWSIQNSIRQHVGEKGSLQVSIQRQKYFMSGAICLRFNNPYTNIALNFRDNTSEQWVLDCTSNKPGQHLFPPVD